MDLSCTPGTFIRRRLGIGTPGEYLAAYPIHQTATPSPNSWGHNGYHEHWINAKNDWIWRPLHEAAARMTQAVTDYPACAGDSAEDRVLRQAGRKLMLAQSSDWPFMIYIGDGRQYAERRFGDHLNRFHDLLDDLDRGQIDLRKLAAMEYMDAIFPELDYHLFA